MITRLPRWVWVGTGCLAFIAGIINVIGLLGFEHQTITHLTGSTTRLSEAVARLDWPMARHIFMLIAAFVAGAIISGFLIQDSTLQLGRRYGVVLLLESALLFIAVPLLKNRNPYGMYATACASGLQNAMVSAYSGAVIRTTHLSGMFTDLGIYLGHGLRGLPINTKRIQLSMLVISAFFLGGIAGALAFQKYYYSALLFPAALTAIVAVVYGGYRTLAAPRTRET